MNIGMMIVFTICGAFVGLLFARLNGKLDAHTEILKEHERKIAGIETRLDAQNAAIKELTGWNSELSERLNNARNRDAEILQNLRDAVTNQIKTDKRVTEIERYYVTYVARKKEPENDETDNSESSV